jgi:transketolase
VSIEVGIALGWREIIGDSGIAISLEHFGASADAKKLFKEFGFTVENVASQIKAALA